MDIFIDLQPWINAIGLGLDFIGVLLLAQEWRIAVRSERAELELAAREVQRELPPSMPRPSGPHQDMFDYMNRRQRAGMKAQRARTTLSSRSGWFVASFLFIAVGFILQIVASIPLGGAPVQ